MRRRFIYYKNDIKINDTDINVNYLTIIALDNDLTVMLSTNACEYCIDSDGVWTQLPANTLIPRLKAGQTVSFRGNLTPKNSAVSGKGIGTFSINKKFALKGNAMSMLFGDDASANNSLIGKACAFYNLFYKCITLQHVSKEFLPATTLSSDCYYEMFYGCTSLTTAPELPATTLADDCYRSMFAGCTSLTTSPELPATKLADSCYYYMFGDCTSLTTAPELPATTLANQCYSLMFNGCTSLTTAPDLPATTLANGCYKYMFDYSGLTTAPALPATTLTNSCYYHMFSNCTSLTTVSELPATTLSDYCYYAMFQNCTRLTTSPDLPATTLADRCYDSMFYNCTSLISAPSVLPAITLTKYCYADMFYGCSKLNYIKMLATNISARNCLYDWVKNVATTGTFVKNPDVTSLPTGDSGIPSGWTVVNDGEESVVNEIIFSVEDLAEEYPTIQYKAEEGMTWEQFCNSKYNVDDWYIEDTTYGNFIIHQYGDKLYYRGSSVKSTDIILSNTAYTYCL